MEIIMIRFFKRFAALITGIPLFQKVELKLFCSEQEVLELIKMYEEYGFIHIKTKQTFSLRYKICFIKKIERFN